MVCIGWIWIYTGKEGDTVRTELEHVLRLRLLDEEHDGEDEGGDAVEDEEAALGHGDRPAVEHGWALVVGGEGCVSVEHGWALVAVGEV